MYKLIFLEPLHVLLINLYIEVRVNIAAGDVIPAHVHVFNEGVSVLCLLSFIVLDFGSLSDSLHSS
jgi:hypothetical protein